MLSKCCQSGCFRRLSATKAKKSAEGQTRTVDTGIFSAVLYHLSYLGRDFYYRIRRGGCQGGFPPHLTLFIRADALPAPAGAARITGYESNIKERAL